MQMQLDQYDKDSRNQRFKQAGVIKKRYNKKEQQVRQEQSEKRAQQKADQKQQSSSDDDDQRLSRCAFAEFKIDTNKFGKEIKAGKKQKPYSLSEKSSKQQKEADYQQDMQACSKNYKNAVNGEALPQQLKQNQ